MASRGFDSRTRHPIQNQVRRRNQNELHDQSVLEGEKEACLSQTLGEP